MSILDETAKKGELSAEVTEHIRGTHGWMRLVAYFSLISSVLGALGALVTFTIFLTIESPMPMGIMVVFMLVSLAMLGLSIYLSFLLLQVSKGYGEFVQSSNSASLEMAIDRQQKFWQIVAILITVGITLYIIVLIFSFLNGASLSGV